MDVIRVGGVPEHFNYSWHIARERGLFAKHNVQVEWSEQKSGTGAMVEHFLINSYSRDNGLIEQRSRCDHRLD